MAAIRLDDVRRVHPDGSAALDGVDLTVEAREMVGVIGPSGSGKTTLVRIIAGLDPVTSGRVWLDDTDMTRAAPRERDVALVAQQRSLYSFLTVAEQLAFPLEMRRMDPGDVRRRTAAERRAFRLGDIWGKRPAHLPAGDAQRTAIARAMVRLPRAMLLDEPLQLLDPPEQQHLRHELQRFHSASGMTMLYTTNDHNQVLGWADRIAVLRSGRIEQVGTSHELLRQPASRFVAGFVGEPAMTFVDATILEEGRVGRLAIGGLRLRFPGGLPGPLRRHVGRTVTLGARPDVVRPPQPGHPVDLRLPVVVRRVQPLGHVDHVEVEVPTGRWTAGFPGGSGVRVGDMTEVAVAVRRLCVFDPDNGAAIWHGDPS